MGGEPTEDGHEGREGGGSVRMIIRGNLSGEDIAAQVRGVKVEEKKGDSSQKVKSAEVI